MNSLKVWRNMSYYVVENKTSLTLLDLLPKKKRRFRGNCSPSCQWGSGHIEKIEQNYYSAIHICISYTIFCWPDGSHPGPPLCPHFEVTQHCNFRPSWRLRQEMTSHAENEPTPLDNDPLQLQVRGRRSHRGVRVHACASARDVREGQQPLISGRRRTV